MLLHSGQARRACVGRRILVVRTTAEGVTSSHRTTLGVIASPSESCPLLVTGTCAAGDVACFALTLQAVNGAVQRSRLSSEESDEALRVASTRCG